ncbi:LAMI_0H05996g1_1 [Lachancea mirantina]|uniref:LAMI_0H05996g1_1 n=1 Tax=Lachancea mirantina TaxID=1230905 RepID=A0A1G4KF30_9SACH|nr:LAMI_0H05996g1_1 [Lachancea mirantina]
MSPKITKMALQEITPEPLTDYRPSDDEKGTRKLPLIFEPAFIRRCLHRIQKYSVWPVMMYFPLHATNTLIIPGISPESAPNDVLMMIREILPSFTSKLLLASMGVHVCSGLVLRVWSIITRKLHRRRKGYTISDERERTSQRNIGLVGGLSGYFVGSYRQLAYSPQALSGYILIPVIIYHMRLMKWIPASLDIDIDFDFVKWLLQHNSSTIKWAAGIIPLSLLISTGAYHIVAGTCQYANIWRLEARKRFTSVFLALVGLGFASIYRLASSSSPSLGHQFYGAITNKLL